MSLPRLRAPKEHGQILAVPPFEQVADLLAKNEQIISYHADSELGRFYAGVRAYAREQVLALSRKYHQDAGEEIGEIVPSCRWLVAGHQPELFHPGVWFKNFVLHRLAQKHGAVSLNLVVDTDTAKPAVLHVPAGDRIARATFDRTLNAPYEEQTVQEEATFAGLPGRISAMTDSWARKPLLQEFWSDVMKQAKRTSLLGERIARARRAMERRWGIVQREVPMSQVCQTGAFRWFVGWILKDLPRFHNIYNQTAQEYRQAHGIRSPSHPVPDLATDGDWLETPFWAWRRGQARRGKLFFRSTSTSSMLRIGNAEGPSIGSGDPGALAGLEAQGLKIRSRALTTTMFARLFLADLFLHGIGGGVYDELTDRLIERFFGIEPPAYMIVSATLLLPLPRFPNAEHKERELARRLRDLIYKPERFLEPAADVEPLLRAKREWIERPVDTHDRRVQRFERIRDINGRLLPSVVPEMERTRIALEECRREKAIDEVASRRDYAFCLYPEEMLREFFNSALK